ncbi:methyltransferase-like protein 17, mitochondrial [Amphibalanus amphitrite]|uniref:methyltransferase-like protein 17, mitochondrial n=1 Tax=Amphibalanus amphitrite TaxID=1232801 RepID=UPI001C92A048|nr:methyltransferase-like protein 17, mitochondrial [Amphibalanus amphitrite]
MGWIPVAAPAGRTLSGLLQTHCWPRCLRLASSRPTPSLDPSLPTDDMESPSRRKAFAAHLKRTRSRAQALPQPLVDALRRSVAEFSVADLRRDAAALSYRLAARRPPTEDAEMQARAQALEQQYISQREQVNEQKLKQFVIQQLRQQVYHWQPLEMASAYEAAVYAVARLAPEFASLLYCFRQVAARDPAFGPQAVLSYGSAVGAALWAARHLWPDKVAEFVGIERRRYLSELCALLAHGGRADAPPDPSVFLRPLLPSSSRLRYPLVVAAHALMEQPSQSERLELVCSLWDRTAPGGRLMLLETGTNAGFLLVLEARDLVLRLAAQRDGAPVHVEAPCPHDGECPRFSRSLTPCHFRVPYWPLALGGAAPAEVRHAPLSYVVMRKGARPAGDRQWPRVVQPVLCRHKHVICRLCTARGALEEVVVTRRRHGPELYQCAKKVSWGDTMPVELRDSPPDRAGDR